MRFKPSRRSVAARGRLQLAAQSLLQILRGGVVGGKVEDPRCQIVVGALGLQTCQLEGRGVVAQLLGLGVDRLDALLELGAIVDLGVEVAELLA